MSNIADPKSLQEMLDWCEALLRRGREHGTDQLSLYAEAYGYLSQGVRMYLHANGAKP